MKKLCKEKIGILHKKGKGVKRHATKAYGGIVPLIFNYGIMWVRGVT